MRSEAEDDQKALESLPKEIELKAVGYVRSSFKESQFRTREELRFQEATLELLPELSSALDGLAEAHSTCFVLFNFDRNHAVHMSVHPRGDPTRAKRGVFTVGSPSRPNHVGVTECEIVERTGANMIRVRDLDALDGTPIIDIKPGKKKDDITSIPSSITHVPPRTEQQQQ